MFVYQCWLFNQKMKKVVQLTAEGEQKGEVHFDLTMS